MAYNMACQFAKWDVHPSTVLFMATSLVNRSPPFLARRHFATLAASSGARCEVGNAGMWCMARGLSSAEVVQPISRPNNKPPTEHFNRFVSLKTSLAARLPPYCTHGWEIRDPPSISGEFAYLRRFLFSTFSESLAKGVCRATFPWRMFLTRGLQGKLTAAPPISRRDGWHHGLPTSCQGIGAPLLNEARDLQFEDVWRTYPGQSWTSSQCS